jgi:hypothetical protein
MYVFNRTLYSLQLSTSEQVLKTLAVDVVHFRVLNDQTSHLLIITKRISYEEIVHLDVRK